MTRRQKHLQRSPWLCATIWFDYLFALYWCYRGGWWLALAVAMIVFATGERHEHNITELFDKER